MIAGLAYRWIGMPCEADLGEDSLTLVGHPHSDLFADPRGAPPVTNAAALVTPLAGDFVLATRIEVDFAAAYDAGGLLVHAGADRWAKLCFECSTELEPTIVSVVTRGLSDDCTSLPLDTDAVWLRLTKAGGAFEFDASLDGAEWHRVRHFALDVEAVLDTGFLVQSPRGEGCTARFTEIGFKRLAPGPPA